MTTKSLIAVLAMGTFASHGADVSATAAPAPQPAESASAWDFDAGADLRISFIDPNK